MITPGKIYQGTELRIAVNFQNDSAADIDPDTVTFKLCDPYGEITTYVYLTDAELAKTSTGDYYVDVTPELPGRWTYRWQTTGTGKKIAQEGEFIVRTSVFYDDVPPGAYR